MDLAQVWHSLIDNLLTPIPLFFVFGIFTKIIRGGVKVPKELYYSISIYLLVSIGLIGGQELAHEYIARGISTIWKPALATLVLGCVTPITSFVVLRYLGGLSISDSAGIAAHYGSTSAVTYIVADSYANAQGAVPDGYLPTLVTILECPGIAVALVIGAVMLGLEQQKSVRPATVNVPGLDEGNGHGKLWEALHEVITGQSLMLMVGSMIIGFISLEIMQDEKFKVYHDFFYNKGMVFRGALCIFLLEMGLVTGERLKDLLKVGPFLIAFGVLIPIVHGFLGAWLGHLAGLNLGGCTVLAAIVSSASYIAAPPAVRLTLPEANPTLSMTASLGITFPFNIALGVPLYYQMAKFLGAKAVEHGAAGEHALQTLIRWNGWA